MEYKDLIKFMPVAIFITKDKKITYANKQAEKLLEVDSYKSILGEDIRKYFKSINNEPIEKLEETLCKCEQETSLGGLQVLSKSGNTIEAEGCLLPIQLNDENVILITVMDVTRAKKDERALKKINEQLSMYVQENEKLMFELRRFRHDTLNILYGLNGFIETKNWDGLRNYFSEIQEQFKLLKDNNPFSIEKIKNLPLRGLLYAKIVASQKYNITMNIEVDNDINIDGSVMKNTDLCEILGIYLDNAIEAAGQALYKKISIYMFEDNECISIIIENTYKDKTSISSNQDSSLSKGTGRGLGLKLSKNILAQYTNVLHNTFICKQVFVQELHILKDINGR